MYTSATAPACAMRWTSVATTRLHGEGRPAHVARGAIHDPGVLLYLLGQEKLTAAELNDPASPLRPVGISGVSAVCASFQLRRRGPARPSTICHRIGVVPGRAPTGSTPWSSPAASATRCPDPRRLAGALAGRAIHPAPMPPAEPRFIARSASRARRPNESYDCHAHSAGAGRRLRSRPDAYTAPKQETFMSATDSAKRSDAISGERGSGSLKNRPWALGRRHT